MVKSQGKALKIVIFIILTAISLYYMLMLYYFAVSVYANIDKIGFTFYGKFPTVLIGGIIEHIFGTAVFVFLCVKYFGYAFMQKEQKAGLLVSASALALATVIIFEVLDYISYTILLGKSYKILKHLRSLLNYGGIARVTILLVAVFVLISSAVLWAKQKRIAD